MSKIVVTVIGRDRPGIVAEVTSLLADFNANIVKARGISLIDLFLLVLVVDISQLNAPLESLINTLRERSWKLGLGSSVELGEAYRREKKLITLDMDGTLVDTEVIDELAKLAGVENEVSAITKAAMEGEIDFEEALKRRVKLLRGLSVEAIEELRGRIPIVPGAHELISELKKAGFVTVLITGSFDIIADYIGRKLGFDYVFSNKLAVKDGRLTGEVEGVVLDARSKLDLLKAASEKEGIALEECVAVGDGANDIVVIRDVGLGIGFNPKKLLRKEANAFVNVKDLKVVLGFLAQGRIKEEIKGRL